jgi:DNA-binding HxlR family transcriptional regulator
MMVMRPNIENKLRTLQNAHKILTTLKQAGPLRFTEIFKKTRSSQRTIAKHLKSLIEKGRIEKADRLYRITESGLQSIGEIETELNELQQRRKIAPVTFPDRIIEHGVREPEPSGHLIGTFQGPKAAVHQRLEDHQLVSPPEQTRLVTEHSKDSHRLPETRKTDGAIGGPKNLGNLGDRFFLYISPELTRSGALPFQLGTSLTLEIRRDCLVIRADEHVRTRVPFVSPSAEASWFKGVCRTATGKAER